MKEFLFEMVSKILLWLIIVFLGGLGMFTIAIGADINLKYIACVDIFSGLGLVYIAFEMVKDWRTL